MSSRRRSSFFFFVRLYLLACFAGKLTAGLAQCLPDQRSALLQLKRGFSSSSKLASWVPGTDCCRWDGVACDRSSGRVVALDLGGRSIVAEKIDESLFNLSSLVTLNLAYNSFDGIPLSSLSFERLANLTSLNLSNAGFSGQIPIGIGRLRKLVSLDLSTFYLNELPSSSLKLHDPSLGKLIANLSNLKELVLDGVDISASGNEWSRALSTSTHGLRVLSLAGCSLTGPIESSLAKLQSLSKFRLDQNQLNSSVPEFIGNFSSLSVLGLRSCGLLDWFPEKIFQLRNLKFLDISENPMLSGQLPEFPEESILESLVLSGTNLSGTLPGSIGNLKFLTTLQLSTCSFYGALPSSMGNLIQLLHLDLSFNNFSGVIPQDVQWLEIQKIVLAHNSLTGPIPSSFRTKEFQSLAKIDLRNNSLNGSIPGSLFALPSLQILQLNLNQFSGWLAEFSNASPSLQTMDLSSNKLQGPIPSSIFELSGLKVFALACNQFSGTLDLHSFRSLKNLSNLDLSNNMLSIKEEIDTSSSYFPSKLSTLKLVSCNLTKIPDFLQNQDEISSLDLSNNKIRGIIPRWIWSIGNGNLNYLNLSNNQFTIAEGPPPTFSPISSMILDLHSNMLQGPLPLPPPYTIVLDYSNNNFTSSIPSDIFLNLNYTVFLSLSNNTLTGEIPPAICQATYLQVLDLSDNNLSGLIPSCLLQSNIDLSVLNLGGNQLSGTLPQNFDTYCALHTINLNGNQLAGTLPRSLVNCSFLEVLDLGNNNFIDSFPYWLGDLSQLRVLVLRSNRFYGLLGNPPGSKEGNYTFSALQIFDVSSNSFTGNLPPECFQSLKAMMTKSTGTQQALGFRYLQYSQSSYYQNTITVTSKGLDMTLVKILTMFTSIDLSNNEFSGRIPEVIGDLDSLYVLNISHNSLSGRIPPHLGDLLQLESLDLSFNQLSGEIPQKLTSLTFLSTLNLSFNNLTGRIPQALQFLTFLNTSFEGNEGLCGTPLMKPCNSSSSETMIHFSRPLIELNWQFISVGLGFGVGLAMIIMPLILWTEGQNWYNLHVDRMLSAIIPQWPCDTCGDMKIGADDAEDDSIEMELEGRKFCVFCTQLEFREGLAIVHHVDCSCPKLVD